jgi:CRISPR-associated protein Csa1
MLHALEDILTRGIVEAKQDLVKDKIDPELRGWNFNSPKLKVPRQNVTLPMYKVADGYCPNDRKRYWVDVKYKRTKKAKPLVYGSVIHSTIEALIQKAKGFLYAPKVHVEYLKKAMPQLKITEEDISPSQIGIFLGAIQNQSIEEVLEENDVDDYLKKKIITKEDVDEMRIDANKIWSHESIIATSRVNQAMVGYSNYGFVPKGDSLVKLAVPITVESYYDGTNLGLGRILKIDAITLNKGTIISDIKAGRRKDFHYLTAVGYGLVLEAAHEQPVDVGVITRPSFPERSNVPEIACEYYALTNELREKFIKKRNRDLIMVADKVDPGLPEDKDDCPKWCDFYELCYGRN